MRLHSRLLPFRSSLASTVFVVPIMVLFVKVPVVSLTTIVVALVGKVKVSLLIIVNIIGAVSVLLVKVLVVSLTTIMVVLVGSVNLLVFVTVTPLIITFCVVVNDCTVSYLVLILSMFHTSNINTNSQLIYKTLCNTHYYGSANNSTKKYPKLYLVVDIIFLKIKRLRYFTFFVLVTK